MESEVPAPTAVRIRDLLETWANNLKPGDRVWNTLYADPRASIGAFVIYDQLMFAPAHAFETGRAGD